MTPQKDKIERLRACFAQHNDVTMAFLFGSQARNRVHTGSDWDIGVYLKQENRTREQALWHEVETIVESEVDLVVLNRAPASVAWNIIRTGLPLAIKNRYQYLRLLVRTSDEANAWYHTTKEYHQIFERSASLSPDDRVYLERIIEFLEQETPDYAVFKTMIWQTYAHDRAKKREVERWAEQLVNAMIDLAKVVLASERQVVPATYRLIVETLGTIPPFDRDDLLQKLAPWIELRNVLAHEYLDYRWKELAAFIADTEPLMRDLIERTKLFLTQGEKEDS